MAMEGPDALLRRIERRSLASCAVLMAIAAVAGGFAAALAVAVGGLIVGVSYRGVRARVDAMVGAGSDTPRRASSSALGLAKFIIRFAMLGGIAYVMMVRLRAHPVWVLAGASSLVVAVGLEAIRDARRARP
jgi:ATP synthase I chain